LLGWWWGTPCWTGNSTPRHEDSIPTRIMQVSPVDRPSQRHDQVGIHFHLPLAFTCGLTLKARTNSNAAGSVANHPNGLTVVSLMPSVDIGINLFLELAAVAVATLGTAMFWSHSTQQRSTNCRLSTYDARWEGTTPRALAAKSPELLRCLDYSQGTAGL